MEKQAYQSPTLEIYEIAVERGFATTGTGLPDMGDGGSLDPYYY